MLNKVEVRNTRPLAPVLPLGSDTANTDPIQIRGIDGLGPVNATINTTPYAVKRGESFSGSKVDKRNIVLKLGLNPDWATQTIGSLRQLLYGYFMTEQWVELRFFDDLLPVVKIEGYVETMEPNIFSQDPELQISIICPDPDFIAVDATTIVGLVGDGTFEGTPEYEIDNIGTVDSGFEIDIKSSSENPDYTGIINMVNTTDSAKVFSITATVDADEYVKISTVPGNRFVQSVAIPSGTTTDLLKNLTDVSVWLALAPGQNIFNVHMGEADQEWTMRYFARFGGL